MGPPRLNDRRDTAAIVVTPSSAPQSSETYALVERLRGDVLPPIARAAGATVYVGGFTASQVDFAHVLSRNLPLFIGMVVALSALLLLVVFRSLLIPLQAALMNLLSIGAALGVVQAIFERGWLTGLVGAQQAPIEAFIPVIVFAIVFGLSMDYEVFLVSRVHEEWLESGDSTRAVREGLVRTGRVITAAAAVMIVVFASFAVEQQPHPEALRPDARRGGRARRSRDPHDPAPRRPAATRPVDVELPGVARPEAATGRDRARRPGRLPSFTPSI